MDFQVQSCIKNKTFSLQYTQLFESLKLSVFISYFEEEWQ